MIHHKMFRAFFFVFSERQKTNLLNKMYTLNEIRGKNSHNKLFRSSVEISSAKSIAYEMEHIRFVWVFVGAFSFIYTDRSNYVNHLMQHNSQYLWHSWLFSKVHFVFHFYFYFATIRFCLVYLVGNVFIGFY